MEHIVNVAIINMTVCFVFISKDQTSFYCLGLFLFSITYLYWYRNQCFAPPKVLQTFDTDNKNEKYDIFFQATEYAKYKQIVIEQRI